MGEKAQSTLCIQQKGVNEHFEHIFDELLDQNTANTRDFEQVLSHFRKKSNILVPIVLFFIRLLAKP
ncbi:hypothetical protein CCS41_11160 [Candidatus Fukatsuia symbiotica]|uniref:Uncharacterized protein n=1 Tax=Candidatus Fukatsuia symbiotica TaxID=1878942 RepID=A0A2U8I6X4_9GAMM|nr:hypothetical protein CCS41_11160 [Candidatus Fukatsuia symbiotica]